MRPSCKIVQVLEEAVASVKSRPSTTIRVDQAVIGGVRGSFRFPENCASRVIHDRFIASSINSFCERMIWRWRWRTDR